MAQDDVTGAGAWYGYGYPQHPDAHPERPWWRKLYREVPGRAPEHFAWARTDRRVVSRTEVEQAIIDILAALDREYPLPPPPPLCQQVWVEPRRGGAGGGHRAIVGVDPCGAVYTVGYAGVQRHAPGCWPPPGAVLVYGPGAPWAPTAFA